MRMKLLYAGWLLVFFSMSVFHIRHECEKIIFDKNNKGLVQLKMNLMSYINQIVRKTLKYPYFIRYNLLFCLSAGGIQQILQSDWFLEQAAFSHTDRYSGGNLSS